MSIHADQTHESKSQSTSSTDVYQKKSDIESTHQFVDNRAETLSQKELQETINSSPRATQLKAFQNMADSYTSNKEQPIQKKENNTGLPDNLKSGIENISGYSMNDVKVHYNSAKPAQLNAHAYAQGTDIHLGSGQEKHLPHEAWHVVQQKQGRVKATKQMKGAVAINDDVGLEKEADVMGIRIASQQSNSLGDVQLKENSTDDVAQRVLIVGSYNETYDIEDMGLWWAMASEHMNSVKEGFEAVILTLKDFDRDYDQEYTISVTDKIRFITHGNEGGTTVANETPKGEGEGDWKDYGMDLKNDNWSDIEQKILTKIEVFNQEEMQSVETGSLLKPYFCFMKENEGLMQNYQEELDDIGVGPVFLTNRYVLSLDMSKMGTNQSILANTITGDSDLSQLFTPYAGWKSFADIKGKLPLLNQYKSEGADSTVDKGEMYTEIFNFIEPKYEKLVILVKDFIAGNISKKAPWEHLRDMIGSSMSGDEKVDI